MMEYGYAGDNSRALVKAEYVNMAREAFAEAKAEIAAEIKKMKDSVVHPSASAQDIRMSCIALFVKENNADPMNCCANLGHIDTLAKYALTGKKPGEA